MGLFGMFGSKETKEEKEFWKAFKTAASSHKEKNLEALLTAQNAYPNAWQGYWLASLYYDMGLGKIAVNENKAKDYQYKAENAAKGTEDEDWVNDFYIWYERNAGNTKRALKDSAIKYRKLGIAAINLYEHNNSIIDKKENDDCKFWQKMFPVFGDDAATDFGFLFRDWDVFEYMDQKTVVSNTNEFTKRAETARKMCNKELEVYGTSKPEKLSYDDMAIYLLGFSFIAGSPYTLDDIAEQRGESSGYIGTKQMIFAACAGCVPAIFHVVGLAHRSDNYDFISEICEEVCGDTLKNVEIGWLEPLVKANDPHAVSLCRKYDICI